MEAGAGGTLATGDHDASLSGTHGGMGSMGGA